MQKILFDYDAITAEITLINFDLDLTLLTHNMALLLTTIYVIQNTKLSRTKGSIQAHSMV